MFPTMVKVETRVVSQVLQQRINQHRRDNGSLVMDMLSQAPLSRFASALVLLLAQFQSCFAIARYTWRDGCPPKQLPVAQAFISALDTF